jgi:hypothetical protein
MQIRQARADLTAHTLYLEKRTIPANAILQDFRMGPGHEGLAPRRSDVVPFPYEGQIYFNIVQELAGKTVLVQSADNPRV